MVHKVLPDARKVHLARNSKLLELILGANSRSKQNGRTAVGTAADDDFLLCVESFWGSISIHNDNSRCLEVTGTITVKDNLVNGGVGHDCDIGASIVLRDEVSASSPDPLVNRSGSMATAMRCFASTEHVVVKRQSLIDEGVHNELGDRSKVVGFDMQRTIVSMALLIGLEPRLGVESLRLGLWSVPVFVPFQRHKPDLSHVLEELLSTPSIQSPVIVVLLAATNAKSAIASTAATKEFSSAKFNLPIVYTGHRWSDNVPIGLRVEVVRPAESPVSTILREEANSSSGLLTHRPCGHFQGPCCAVRPQ